MQENFHIKKIAVLGAGVMGAQIAAHCVNAGVETLLFDLAAKEGPRNALVDKAIANLAKLKPSPLATPQTLHFLQAKNYDDNLAELGDCDLIIEAIAERMDWKADLYKKIASHLSPHSILASNTSGLSINALADVLPESLHSQFCGIHFFNPPRYMHLAELIPAKSTRLGLVNHLESWLTSQLGKGVVIAKDTPNFIANRIGVFSLLVTLHHAKAMQIGLDEVDALTGPLIGRPKSATCRTMDVVGLDTMQHVVHTMEEHLKNDPWYDLYRLPTWLDQLIKEGHLGQKTGQGIYRKSGKTIEVFDLESGGYRQAAGAVSEEVKAIMKINDVQERMARLSQSDNKQAQFLSACYRDLFHYCAYHLVDIARSVRDIDLAMRWGFGWQQGPFEIWQAAGVSNLTAIIKDAINSQQALSTAPLPEWLTGYIHFYTKEGAFSPQSGGHLPSSKLPVYQRQIFQNGEAQHPLTILYENEGVCLSHLQDDVAIVSFKSKANTIGQAVLDGLQEAIVVAEKQCRGLIVYQNDAANFSSGADLRGVASLINANRMDALEAMISQFQQTAMQLKYALIPTVAALRGRALGGGCELMMQCDAVIAAFESYPGLVEAGVGLIPGGGGCKEMAMRAAHQAGNADLMAFIQPRFQQIATAFVAGSAPEAMQSGYLRASDAWLMHQNEVLFAALAKINELQALNYQPPLKASFKVAGREGRARLQAGLVNWLEGGFISQHDYLLAVKLAEVICGGNVNQGTMVDEWWMLNREREAFVELASTALTQARITYMLETGKPLRN